MIRHRKNRSFLSPVTENLVERLSNDDQRFRRILFRGLLVLVTIFLGYTFFSGTYGFIHIAKMHAQREKLTRENHQLLIKLTKSDWTRDRLTNDMNYIEFIARTRHNLSRPDEVIYQFKE